MTYDVLYPSASIASPISSAAPSGNRCGRVGAHGGSLQRSNGLAEDDQHVRVRARAIAPAVLLGEAANHVGDGRGFVARPARAGLGVGPGPSDEQIERPVVAQVMINHLRPRPSSCRPAAPGASAMWTDRCCECRTSGFSATAIGPGNARWSVPRLRRRRRVRVHRRRAGPRPTPPGPTVANLAALLPPTHDFDELPTLPHPRRNRRTGRHRPSSGRCPPRTRRPTVLVWRCPTACSDVSHSTTSMCFSSNLDRTSPTL
jgi:hypothetical protein